MTDPDDNARSSPATSRQCPALTQGLSTVLRAEHLLLLATGARKAASVAAAVEGPLTASVPASVLQLHPHATVVLDKAAAGLLQGTDHYRYVRRHRAATQQQT